MFSYRLRHRWFYPLISFMMGLSLVLITPHSTQAIPWWDLILRGVEVIQLSNISERQEVQLGQQMNAEILNRQFQLYRNRQVADYVDEVGQRMAAASDRPNIPYTFQVVSDDNINAFATMGGFVYVTTGLLKAADNEAQLASVLGHEIGHIASRHAIEQMRTASIQRGVATAAGMDRNTMIRLGVDLAVHRPRSRKDELEADRRGLQTMTRAGYAPSATIGFMEKLLDRASPPSFLSTHPAAGDRITALEAAIDPQRANVGDGLNEAAYKASIRPLLQGSSPTRR